MLTCPLYGYVKETKDAKIEVLYSRDTVKIFDKKTGKTKKYLMKDYLGKNLGKNQ